MNQNDTGRFLHGKQMPARPGTLQEEGNTSSQNFWQQPVATGGVAGAGDADVMWFTLNGYT